jgi:hypothetical protein
MLGIEWIAQGMLVRLNHVRDEMDCGMLFVTRAHVSSATTKLLSCHYSLPYTLHLIPFVPSSMFQ